MPNAVSVLKISSLLPLSDEGDHPSERRFISSLFTRMFVCSEEDEVWSQHQIESPIAI